jgi:pyruvate ferredoxin oxidoreductase beta subunit
MAGHHLPYVCQASPGYFQDLIKKVETAMEIEGPKFMNTLSPALAAGGTPTMLPYASRSLRCDCCFWPLYEVRNDTYALTGQSKLIADGKKEKVPLVEYLKPQGRFKHLLAPKNKEFLDSIQGEVDRRWERLVKLSKL